MTLEFSEPQHLAQIFTVFADVGHIVTIDIKMYLFFLVFLQQCKPKIHCMCSFVCFLHLKIHVPVLVINGYILVLH